MKIYNSIMKKIIATILVILMFISQINVIDVLSENIEFNMVFADGTCGKLCVDENFVVSLIIDEDK